VEKARNKVLDKFVIGKLFNKSLKDGLSVFEFTVVNVIIAYMTYYLCEKIVKSRFRVCKMNSSFYTLKEK